MSQLTQVRLEASEVFEVEVVVVGGGAAPF